MEVLKLLSLWYTFCVHHTNMHQFRVDIVSISSHIVIYIIYIGCLFRLAVTCHLHFWQNDQDVLHGAMVTQGWNEYQNNSTESWSWRRTFSCCSCWDLKPQPFNNKSDTQPLSCPCWTDLRYSKKLAYSLLEEKNVLFVLFLVIFLLYYFHLPLYRLILPQKWPIVAGLYILATLLCYC